MAGTALTGRRVLLTGAAGGIGAAIADAAVNDNARVVAHDLDLSAVGALAARLGPSVIPVAGDLTAAGHAAQLWETARCALGGVDVLINNAGVCRPVELDADVEPWLAGWDQTLGVNVIASAVLCRAAVRAAASGAGEVTIVNVASVTAFRGATPGAWAYAASKGALVALTRSIARYHGREGVTAFVVAPGVVDTPMGDYMLHGVGRVNVSADSGLGEITTAEDVASVVAWLASGRARHASGSTIDVNGAAYVH